MKNKIKIVLIIIMFIIFAISLFFFINGSLEMYPTDEQQEKVRIVSVIFLTISIVLEIILIKPNKKTQRELDKGEGK